MALKIHLNILFHNKHPKYNCKAQTSLHTRKVLLQSLKKVKQKSEED